MLGHKISSSMFKILWFQYVFLQLKELRKIGVSSPFSIREKLKTLPQGLDETYDRVLQNIDEYVRPEVRAMLIWLAFGSATENKFDITLESLAQMHLFQPDRDGVVEDDLQLFQADEILKFMPGLVITFLDEHASQEYGHQFEHCDDDWISHSSTSERERLEISPKFVHVRLAHFSVQEYLMSDRICQGPAKPFAFSETEAHVYIARVWPAYHLYSCSAKRPQQITINLRRGNPDVCWQWAYHMEAVPPEDWPQELEHAALRALSPQSKGFSFFVKAFTSTDLILNEIKSYSDEEFTLRLILKPHCCTAFAGWFKLTQLLLSGTSAANRYLTQLDFDTVLFYAAYNGKNDVVILALQMGANIHSRHLRKRRQRLSGYDDWILETVLQTAADNGHLTTVDILLAQGADINARDSCGQSVLHVLVREGRCSPYTMAFFLDRCADVNALDNMGCSILEALMLSYKKHSDFEDHREEWWDTIRLLVHRGADPHTCSSSLGEPFATGLKATQYLLDKGADVNQADSSGQTALHKAVIQEKKDAFRLLLDRGADVKASRRRSNPTVMQVACYYSDYTMGYLPDLLNEDAGLAGPPGSWGSVIHAICADGLRRHGDDCLAMVRMALDAGADVNAEGGKYGYPLQAAVAACYWNKRLGKKLVEFLLNTGAHVNAEGGEYGSSLQAACQLKRPELVQLLLGRHASPNVAGGEFGNPLAAAVGEPHGRRGCYYFERDPTSVLTIVGLLLDAVAHINARGNKRYGTALHAAAGNASANVVRLLLERGADVKSPKGALHGSALQAACARSDCDPIIPRLLLHKRADVLARGGQHGSALQAACAKRGGDPSIPSLLLKHGADVLARGGRYGCAFHAAVVTGNFPKDRYHNAEIILPRNTLQLLLASEPRLDVNNTDGPGRTTAIQGLMRTHWDVGWIHKQEYDSVVASIKAKIHLLIEHGVDVNIGGGKYGSPLQAACALDPQFSFDRAEILLDRFPTIEVNNLGGFFGSPLQAAAYSGQKGTVCSLLKRNADVHARGGRYGSALNAAIVRERWDIVRILRHAGARGDCEIMKSPDQLWLWQIERKEHFDWLNADWKYKQYGEDAVARYEKFWEVESGKEIPVDRVLEWLFG
ncbi:hypothetical protein Daus18300_009869 [Diaporthe australafricana]|uniref:Ankyrin repeat protein n=1 Tax=Diaporthe australafricana TaxID=127596 RepID=A0ABR3WCK2_9PEZI